MRRNRTGILAIVVMALQWLILPVGSWGQPPCVECCCGDPEEVGFPCGDFEEPPFAAPGGWIDYGAGQSYCGWTVVSGSISIHHGDHNNLGAGNPNGASQHLDLNGSSPGTVERTLTGLTAGSQYTITLWYAAHNGAGTATAQMLINNGAWLDATWSTNVPGNVNWEFLCLSFVADAPTAVIRLIGSSNNPCCGMLIDDMSMWECDPDAGPPQADNPPAPFLQVGCHEPVPPAPTLDLTDDCDSAPEQTLEEQTLPQPCGYDLQRTWTLTDACGQSATLQQVVEVRDTEAPFFLQTPTDLEIPCGSDVLGEFYVWLQTNGGGIAQDLCDANPVWTADYLDEPGSGCGETTVTFTVTDACGNSAQASAQFRVTDAAPPVLISPATDASVFCVASPADSLAAWLDRQGGALAADPCQPLVWTHDFQGDSLAPAITVSFTATDGCGQSVSSVATFFQSQGSDTLRVFAQTCDPSLAGTDTLVVGIPGCETVTITRTDLLPSDTLVLEWSVCDPTQAGLDTLVLQNIGGCDSLIITRRSLAPSDTLVFQAITCDPTSAGADTLVLVNQYGCDSLIITVTSFSLQFESVNDLLICGSGTPYSDTVLVQTGPCDSLFITRYTFHPPDTTALGGTTCDPAQAGVFTQVLQGALGCDSTVVTTIVLSPRDTVLVEGVTCDPDEEDFGTVTLSNQYGCDSVVFTAILYLGTDTTFLTRVSCDSAQAGVQVNTYPLAGTPCDSVVVETVTWAPQSLTLLPDSVVCAPFGPAADTTALIAQTGCDSLVIRPFRYVALQGQPQAVAERCAGERNGAVSLSAISGGDPPYLYRLDSGTWQSGSQFGGLFPGLYGLTVMDANGCSRTYPGLIVGPGESLTLDAGPDLETEAGAMLSLNVSGSQTLAQVLWSATDPLSCPSCAQTTMGPLTQSQTVSVQAWTASGCTAIDLLQVALRALRTPAVYIPNSFSPNADGINDIFSVYGNDQILSLRSMAIYDRWGNALFHRQDLPLNDPSAGWDGTFRGKLLDPGVYVYVVELELANGSTRLYKGDVTLLR
jgi:gliding motility-associated-like protein